MADNGNVSTQKSHASIELRSSISQDRRNKTNLEPQEGMGIEQTVEHLVTLSKYQPEEQPGLPSRSRKHPLAVYLRAAADLYEGITN